MVFLYISISRWVSVYKKGLLFKKERSIKRERVQTVNIRTNYLQRLLGVATVQVETAGGSKESELSLTAVNLEETHNIKAYLENYGQVPDYKSRGMERTDKIENVHKIPLWDLFLAGATSGRFMLLFSLIAAAFSQFYPYIPETYLRFLVEQIIPENSVDFILLTVLIFLLLFLSWMISTIVFVIQYADFTITRQADDIRLSWGIIEQKEFNLNLNRLQAVSIKEDLLKQPFGLCSITAEVAGGGSKEHNYVTVLYPLLRVRELTNFLDQILPEYNIPENMQSLPTRSRKRYVFRLLAPAIVIVALSVQTFVYGWILIIILPLALLLGQSRYKTGGTFISDKQLTLRFRNINRYHVLMMKNHIQSLELSSNVFQRIRNLNTVKASVLSSPSGKDFKVVDIDNEESNKLWDWFSRD